MINIKKTSSEQLIFPIIVGLLSLLNIVQNFWVFQWTSVLVSIIGLLATILFFLDIKKTSLIFYSWIITQLITYSSPSFTYDANQFPYIFLGIKFVNPNSVFAVNFVPLFFLIGYRIMKMYDLIGKEVIIQPIKADTKLNRMEGEITEIINRHKEGKWLKVAVVDGMNAEPNFVLIKPKGEERFSRKTSIIAFVNECGERTNFIDWGKVKLK